MTIVVNGRDTEVTEGTTLGTVVNEMSGAPAGIAVAVNDAVVRRHDWPTTRLRPGDRIEVLTAVQGG